MEKKKESTIWGLRFPKLRGTICTPIMENQMEKNMDNEMEPGVI